MKKRGLAILIAVLGVLCVVCGALLLLQDRILDASGRTFEYSKVVFRGEKIKITMEI